VSAPVRLRLFLDSNVLMGGLVARWGLDKAVLSLCSARICTLVLAEAVRVEVKRNLALHAERLALKDVDQPIKAYHRFIQLSNPERIPFPELEEVLSNRHLIRHQPDIPVLRSAMAARPDWLLTNNTEHFTPLVAKRTGLRIATPVEFFRTLSSLIP
jgi:predicted nucleic acid-binding protein